jgi:hypothetical protein
MGGIAGKIGKANQKYYAEKGKKIYADFSTFAQGRALARCNAIEFCLDFARRPSPVVVCEYGIGKGDFAKNLLGEVKRLDKRLYSKTRYYLYDFSEKMLSDARKNLAQHSAICVFGKFDATREAPFQQFDYCRINELLTDLPAGLYCRKGEGIFDDGGKPAPIGSLFVSKFLERIDEGRLMPFNFKAQEFLLSLCRLGRPKFRIDLFDYGFYSADEVNLMPVEEWNRLMVRNYGGQLTVDLNIPLLLAALSSEGFAAKAERQKEYAERVLGMKLELDDSGGRLDYVKSKKSSEGISEDDGFYHLRIGR